MELIRKALDYHYALLEYFEDVFGYPYGTIILLSLTWGLAGLFFIQTVSP